MSKLLQFSAKSICSTRTVQSRSLISNFLRPLQHYRNMSGKDDIAESIEATKVDYKRLGNSGLRVSVPIFGCMSFGSKQCMCRSVYVFSCIRD